MKKKLIIIQRDFKDCGVCSLASIVKYYGGDVSLERLRNETCTGLNGTSAYHLIGAAKELGFDGVGLEIDDLLDLKSKLPVIAHVTLDNGLNHFVVIYEINNEEIILMDPAIGKKKMSINEFCDIWNNVVILLTPVGRILKLDEKNYILDFIKYFIFNNKLIILSLLISSFLLMVVMVILNYNFEVVLDFIEYRNMDNVYYVLSFFLVLTILKILFEYLRNYYENYLSREIEVHMNKTFLEKILFLPLNIVKTRTSGEIFTRITELESVKTLVVRIVLGLFLDLVLAIAASVMLWQINNVLFSVLCLIFVVYLLFNLLFNKSIYNRAMKTILEETKFNESILESIDNIETLKNLNYISKQSFCLERVSHGFVDQNFIFKRYINILEVFKNFIIEIGLFLVSSIAFIMIFNNTLELVSLITFNAMLLYVMNPIKNSIDMIPQYYFLKASLQKVSDFLINDNENDVDNDLKFIDGDIKFSKIVYSPNKYNYIFNNFNLVVSKGSKNLLVGKSGSGKSTICRLLVKTVTLNTGKVLINGIDINSYSLKELRSNILFVSQDEKLFNNTVIENLTLGKNIDFNLINEVLEICELKDLINSLPLSLNTKIFKDGNNFSGGEGQRIVLARSLLLDRKIYIFDEALSEVGSLQRERIITKMMNYLKDKTVIFVSHNQIKYRFDRVIRIGDNE